MKFEDLIRKNYPVSQSSMDELMSKIEVISVKKRQTIVEQGVRSYHLFWVKEGLFRVEYNNDGKEDTICFGLDGDMFCSMYSFYQNEAAKFSCIALTDASVYRISYEDFNNLIKTRHDLSLWLCSVLVEQVYLFERRYVYLGTYDAAKRYEQFKKMRPEIFPHVPLKYLAQYLKITPQALSRIRKEETLNNK